MDCFICHAPSRWLRVGFEKAFRKVEPVCDECVKRFERRDGGWAVRPLFGAVPLDWRDATTADAWQAEIDVVCGAVERSFPDAAPSILPTLRSAGDHYSFNKWGMYVGVEPDGYVHT